MQGGKNKNRKIFMKDSRRQGIKVTRKAGAGITADARKRLA